MKYATIRQAFTDFFIEKGHQKVSSSPLVPLNDPTLMFNNAGMNQFKDVFLGADQRSYNRAVTIQKCLRAGGKHNDLENVGFTARHHTFFEMMGNFSFGDYFKEEAIAFAWEFLTQKLGIPEERLFVTVFTTDDEAAEIWEKKIGVPKSKISRFGEKDNFWRMGQTGPCGPCSEIFYDHRPDEPPVPIDQDEDRYVEIWNLVFMQFFEDETGKKTPLPKPSVDTGAGIERIAAALQGFHDNYQCDIFEPIITKICQSSGRDSDWESLEKDPDTLGAVKVVADHARSAAFLIEEGVLPSNEGKGYVLRRIMRRAIRYARKLNKEKSLYPLACEQVIKVMSPYYPELTEKADFILQAVRDEETRFLKTLDHGSEILVNEIKKLRKSGQSTINGAMAFTLYGTYGFPMDLTEVIAKEHGFTVDSDGFYKELEKDKEKARGARKSFNVTSNDQHLGEWTQGLKTSTKPTDFVGYTELIQSATVVGLSDGEKAVDSIDSKGWAVFDTTPFYAEGGGQVADQGSLKTPQGQTIAAVSACKKMNDIFLHSVEVESGSTLSVNQKIQLSVQPPERQATANNHSATHLLNATLKKVLGDHINQAGSLVNEQKLRFDFSHNKPVTNAELLEIEELVNEQIAQAVPVQSAVMGQKEAIEQGAVAMFGEKYDDEVRVISMGQTQKGGVFSMELCGGTHVRNTAEIGLFKIISETGVAAGTRRIEAVTGAVASRFLNKLASENIQARESLNMKRPKPEDDLKGESLTQRLRDLQNQVQELEQQLKAQAAQSVSIEDIISGAKDVQIDGQSGKALFTRVDVSDRQVLSEIADKIRDKQPNVIMGLIGEAEGDQPKPLIIAVSKSLKSVHAGKITKEICQIMDGKGGGRPDFAQGSVTNMDKLGAAKDKFYELLG